MAEPCLLSEPPPAVDLVEVVQRLSLARDLPTVQDLVRRAARRLTGADGATFVLRDGDQCHYVDEDAIEPLWKGRRFPLSACVSGWAMLHREPVVIPDVYADPRVPADAYRPTFVKSMVMVPIRTLDPLGAIGTYWAAPRHPDPAEVRLLQALADTTAVALENVRVFAELEERVRARTAELEAANRDLLAAHRRADRVFAAYARALPGTVIDGKYRLEEELGAGGFGVVFRGRHLTLDRDVAVKVFRPAPGNDSALGLQRFLREGAAASRLDHPNAVRVLDSGVSDGGLAFLVMDLLVGRSLARELAGGPLGLRRAVGVAARVADVLAAAHRRGIVHRDVKPDNIFLHRPPDGGEVVKVVDFGIAKFFGDAAQGAPLLTLTGEYMGTPSYVAPERMTGAADDGRSDVFSLAATLHEMVTGRPPWTRQELLELAAGVGRDRPPPVLSAAHPGVPPELAALVLAALSGDCTRRPTAAAFAAALDRLAPGLTEAPAAAAPAPPGGVPTGTQTAARG